MLKTPSFKLSLLPSDFKRWLREVDYAQFNGPFIQEITHPDGLSGAYREFEIYGDAFARITFNSNTCKALVLRQETLPVVWKGARK